VSCVAQYRNPQPSAAVLDSPRIAQEVMQRDCIRTGATIGADARVKAQALEDVKAFLRQTLLS